MHVGKNKTKNLILDFRFKRKSKLIEYSVVYSGIAFYLHLLWCVFCCVVQTA